VSVAAFELKKYMRHFLLKGGLTVPVVRSFSQNERLNDASQGLLG